MPTREQKKAFTVPRELSANVIWMWNSCFVHASFGHSLSLCKYRQSFSICAEHIQLKLIFSFRTIVSRTCQHSKNYPGGKHPSIQRSIKWIECATFSLVIFNSNIEKHFCSFRLFICHWNERVECEKRVFNDIVAVVVVDVFSTFSPSTKSFCIRYFLGTNYTSVAITIHLRVEQNKIQADINKINKKRLQLNELAKWAAAQPMFSFTEKIITPKRPLDFSHFILYRLYKV